MRFDTAALGDFQRDFLAAVTAATPDHPALKIHHDTWLLGLIEALRDACPVTAEVLGEESFNAFARDYVRTHPLRRGDRGGYGEGFADMLQTHPHLPAAWLPDLVRFEQALHHAHGARDAEPSDFEALLSPEARIALHPSVRLLTLDHDVKGLISKDLGAGASEVRAIACDLLVGRNRDNEVIQLCLAPYELDFITLIDRHASLFTALEQLSPNDDDMALLQTLLARLVQHGLLIAQKDHP